jgi:hypothetical protein
MGSDQIVTQSYDLVGGELRTGVAVIRSTVDNQTVREYSVEILKVYENSGV